MKVTKTILESIIRRTLIETSAFLDNNIDDSEETYKAAYEIVKTLFGPKKFNIFLSRAGGTILQSIMIKSMPSDIDSVYFPKMVDNMKKVITSDAFHNKMISSANSQIDRIVSENTELAVGSEVAKRSVGYLIKAIFSLDIAEESFFALFYRFYLPDSAFADNIYEISSEAGVDLNELLKLSLAEGTITFESKDLDYIKSDACMKGLARKVFDQVTKFYYFHDEYDDMMYGEYGLHFNVGFGDDRYLNFETGWLDPGLEI